MSFHEQPQAVPSSARAPGELLPPPLRILNVVRFPIGGIRNYLRYTYSHFDPAAYSTTVVTVDRPEAALIKETLESLGTELETVAERRAFIGLLLATARLARSGAFALAHSQGTTAAVVTALATRGTGLAHVVTLHETFRPGQFPGILGEAKRRLLGRILGSADAIVTVTADARENLLRHIPLAAAAARRVEVIRNGVDVDTLLREAAHSHPALRARFGIEDDASLIGYVGRFMPEKGFDVLLDAVGRLAARSRRLPPFRIIAVNDGAFIREYRKAISEAGLDDVFLFAGFQPTVAGTFTELDAVVMPSRREACPLVAMETMVLGCPLIASDCIGLREVTAGTPSLQSVAGDAGSLAAQIEQFLLHRDVIRARARAYVDEARRTFDSAEAAERLLALFARTLQGRQSHAAVA